MMFGVCGASYYVTFRNDMHEAYLENVGKGASDDGPERALNKLMFTEVGDTRFVGYLKLAAREGFSDHPHVILLFRRQRSGTEGRHRVGLLGGRILLAAGFAAVIAAREAGQPFDEEANAWYGAPARWQSPRTRRVRRSSTHSRMATFCRRAAS
ncbi:MAG: hypothetical protein U0521_28180 [Anaerolineae bacterium]